jgi:hypothetical protein
MSFDTQGSDASWEDDTPWGGVPKEPGKLVLPFGCSTRTIYAGPYHDKPEGMFGVKMAAEIDAPYHISVPVQDFSVPDGTETVTKAAETVLEALAFNQKVYVGCMGGIGRTGLFLAILAKALGVEDPVMYVRGQYHKHAVETLRQLEFLDALPMGSLYRVASIAKMEAGMADFFGLFGLA